MCLSKQLLQKMQGLHAIEGQTGTSAPIGLETDNEPFRIFYDKGEQLNETGRPYWMGTTETTNYAGEDIGVLSLDLGTPTGIYLACWRGWTQLLFSPTVTRVTALTIEQIIALKRWEDTRVYIYHPEGAIVAVVDRVKIKVTDAGLTKSIVEYRKYEP